MLQPRRSVAASTRAATLRSGDKSAMKLLRFTGWTVAWVIAFLCALWSIGALYYDFPKHLGAAAALVFVGVLLAALIFVRGKVLKLASLFAAFALILIWWLTLKPTNDRNWQPDVAQTGWGDINGDEVILHNVRNCDYRSENDYTPRWETRIVRLSHIAGLDLFIMYWGSPLMAHPIASFRFTDTLPLCFSVEARKEVGQEFSAVASLYRQAGLIYVVADERDSIRVRANYRHGEDVYLYRTLASQDRARVRFLEYVNTLTALHTRPRWYNVITTNCTTAIRDQRPPSERMLGIGASSSTVRETKCCTSAISSRPAASLFPT